jgi:hypothetical protein
MNEPPVATTLSSWAMLGLGLSAGTTLTVLYTMLYWILRIGVGIRLPNLLAIFLNLLRLLFGSSSSSVSPEDQRRAAYAAAAGMTGSSSSTTAADGSSTEGETMKLDPNTLIAPADFEYLVQYVRPNCTVHELLALVCSTPSLVAWSEASLRKIAVARQERQLELDAAAAAAAASKQQSFAELVTDGDTDGWGNDDDDEDDELAARQHWTDTQKEAQQALREAAAARKLAQHQEELQAQEQARVQQIATGKNKDPLEGLGDQVILGQEWVMQKLTSLQVWPPPLMVAALQQWGHDDMSTTPDDDASSSAAGLRRNLCMLTARLYSQALNTDAELLAASAEKRVDPTYFRASMEFRQKCLEGLENLLRLAIMLRSHSLTVTLVQSMAWFKIGVVQSATTLANFEQVMKQTYGVVPSITAKGVAIQPRGTSAAAANKEPTPAAAEETIITNDTASAPIVAATYTCPSGELQVELSMVLERVHAEQFLKTKLAQLQKQGIPPQIGLATYREIWWLLSSCDLIRPDGTTEPSPRSLPDPVLHEISQAVVDQIRVEYASTWQSFAAGSKLVVAWPMTVANIAQKSAKIALGFSCPESPGHYRYTWTLHSSDFLQEQPLTFCVDIHVPEGSSSAAAGTKDKTI